MGGRRGQPVHSKRVVPEASASEGEDSDGGLEDFVVVDSSGSSGSPMERRRVDFESSGSGAEWGGPVSGAEDDSDDGSGGDKENDRENPGRGGKGGAKGGKKPAGAKEGLQTPSKNAAKVQSSTPAARNRRDVLCAELFTEMNAVIFEGKLPAALPITWNARLNKTAGLTIFRSARGGEEASKGVLAHKVLVRVELSTKVLDDAEKLKQTLCHELCHVAAWVINETRQPPHGPAFKYWAALSAQRYPGMKVTTCHNYDIAYKFRYQCQLCLQEYGRHSKSINLATARCGSCRGALGLMPKMNQDGTPAKERGAPNGYAQYVKANFSAVKARHPRFTAPEVLKALSTDWKEHKIQLASHAAQAAQLLEDDSADPPLAA